MKMFKQYAVVVATSMWMATPAPAAVKIADRSLLTATPASQAMLEVHGEATTDSETPLLRVNNSADATVIEVDGDAQVGIGTVDPNNRLEIDSGVAGQSGLLLSGLAGAASDAASTIRIAVDANGDVGGYVTNDLSVAEVRVGTVIDASTTNGYNFHSVTFTTPFSAGVIPLVFVTVVDDNEHGTFEHVQQAMIVDRSNTGFSFYSYDPSAGGSDISGFDWMALAP
ncbi:hypothetical protein OAS86_04130 [Gammaproteobacteria bacterium]|nr:hypothetical protein [Gammaproteobacteria bacterium]